MQTNYHMHTTRCHHAEGTDEEYVVNAIQNGYQEIGFSDHACWPYKSGYSSFVRMKVDEFDEYKESVEKLKEKYKDQISIKLGMEAEYYPEYMDWLLDFAIEKNIDYLVFGNHYLGSEEYGPYTGYMPSIYDEAYYDSCIEGMETGMYACLAHPELILRSGKKWNSSHTKGFKRVCQAAKRLDIPLEYNCLGMQLNKEQNIEGYPHHKFWEIAAQTGNKAIIGMDAHQPADLNQKFYNQARSYLEGLGIQIVEQLPVTDFAAIKEKKEQKENE